MSKNDITGDALVSKAATQAYRDNYDLIFRKDETPSDEQLQQFGYAPGDYYFKCARCKSCENIGDKHALMCKDCAITLFKVRNEISQGEPDH